MIEITDDQFNDLIAQSLDELPNEYTSRLNNVLITYEDVPSLTQRQTAQLRGNQALFGLYEGVPLTKRGAGYNLVLPDRITIFKYPMLQIAQDVDSLKVQVKHTLWHEVAHYFGLGHDRIHEIESRWQ
ncbi:MAG: metallopeptidase family protein [bacterium]|nr:metallopeptidase family protein [bacterium]